jgi:outer membrane biosynthesis protein TonB
MTTFDRSEKHKRALDTKGRNALFNRDKDRKDWLVPLVLSLAFHAGAILFLLPKLLAAPVTFHRPEAIQVRIATPNETQHFFSELPPDRADVAPKKPDALSNVTSRARDRVPGGDTDLPRMQGKGDAPLVKLAPNKSSSRAPAASPLQSTEPAGDRAADSRPALQKPGGPLVRVPTEEALRGSAGNSAIDQPEMAHPEGNAATLGDVSLNTIAWDYAPWLQRFGSQVMERWYPPPAYSLGILKEGGWALIEVEISRSGKLLRLDLLDQQGHPSLTRAAESALRSVAPIEPLPADFPEPTLILRIRMIYPSR